MTTTVVQRATRGPLRVARLLLVLGATVPAELMAQAQPRDTVQLPEIVVTPTSLPTRREAVAAAVTVLSGPELAGRGVATVGDALREVVGATVAQEGSFGGLTSLFLRGGQSDYTKVLVDGVPLNDPGGAIDLTQVATENVDRIEIVRGPASVVYGSDAVSGVVQIFTRRGRGPVRAHVAVEDGTYDGLTPGTVPAPRGSQRSALRWEAGVSGGRNAMGYSLAVARTSTAGLYGTPLYDNAYGRTVVSGLLRVAPDARTDASLMMRYSDHTFHYPTDGAGQLVDANAFDHATTTTVGLNVGRFVLPGVETRLLLAEHRSDGGTDDQPDGPADTVGYYASSTLATVERRRAEGRVNVYGARGVLTVGGVLERESEQGADQYFSSYGNSTDQVDVKRLGSAAYVELQGDPVPRVSLNAGVRLDRSDAFGTFLTYRGGAVYRLPAGLHVRAMLGSGFKEPTFYQNFATGYVRGNPALKPEHSLSWEVGLDQTLGGGRLRLGATFFDQRFRDLIDYTGAPPSPSDPNYFNIAAAGARGLELSAEAAPVRTLDLRAGYTVLHTRVVTAGFDPGPGALLVQDSALLRRPARAGFAALHYRPFGRGDLTLDVHHVGRRADLDYAVYPAERVALPAYTTVGAGAAFRLIRVADRETTLSLRVDNLLDTAYEEVLHFPARGRTVWVGARARF
jgi:vitamin B12 transporter